MFGYITTAKEQVGEENFKIFTAYYCGLCKAMGRQCSQASRLSLNYDITFLALVLSSVSDSPNICKNESCIAHPLKKRDIVCNDKALDYSANMGVLLSYLKMADDWHDEKSIKALFAMLVLWKGVKKARKKYPDEYDYIHKKIKELSVLEEEKCSETDKVCDCFAKILEKLFTPDMVEDKKTREILAWLGYNLGRWIYVMDAINDLDEDYKSGNYNPFLIGIDASSEEYKERLLKNQEVTLTMTLNNAAGAFDLLKIYKNYDLLHKMIYGSLYLKQNAILGKLRKTGEDNGSI